MRDRGVYDVTNLTTEQVEAIEAKLSHWSGCEHGVVWKPDALLDVIASWRAQRAVVEAARCVAAAWDETERGPVDHDTARFECALEELTTALAAVEGGEGEAT
jgi:hypothetical protein